MKMRTSHPKRTSRRSRPRRFFFRYATRAVKISSWLPFGETPPSVAATFLRRPSGSVQGSEFFIVPLPSSVHVL